MAERQHCGTCGTRLTAHGVCPRCVPSLRTPPKATVQGVGPPPAVQKLASAEATPRQPVDTQPGYRSSRPPPPAAVDQARDAQSQARDPQSHADAAVALAAPTHATVDTIPGHTAAAAKQARRAKAPPAMTAVAGEAFTITKAFNAAFARPFPGWKAELASPVGPSTGGGVQALQHIALIAPGGQRIAVGSVDPARHTANLRAHPLVDQLHRQRFGASLPIAADDYKRFQDMVSRLLGGASFSVTVETVVAPEPKTSAWRGWPWLLVAVALLALAVAWWLRRAAG